MKPADFHPDNFERGARYTLELELGPPARNISLPVLLVRGSRPGKRLVVTAAVHGDEYEGVRAIYDVVRGLDPAVMSGDFLSVPVANPPAFWNGTRSSPLDDGNLARAEVSPLPENGADDGGAAPRQQQFGPAHPRRCARAEDDDAERWRSFEF